VLAGEFRAAQRTWHDYIGEDEIDGNAALEDRQRALGFAGLMYR
jgi:hypothetical protein